MKPEYHKGPDALKHFKKGMTVLLQAKKPEPKRET
jgi:hypothetical protein